MGGGCYLALSQVDGEHKRLPFFGVHRVKRTYYFTAYTFCDFRSKLFSLKGEGASDKKKQTLTTLILVVYKKMNLILTNF